MVLLFIDLAELCACIFRVVFDLKIYSKPVIFIMIQSSGYDKKADVSASSTLYFFLFKIHIAMQSCP